MHLEKNGTAFLWRRLERTEEDLRKDGLWHARMPFYNIRESRGCTSPPSRTNVHVTASSVTEREILGKTHGAGWHFLGNSH